jgi:hypothetical protein
MDAAKKPNKPANIVRGKQKNGLKHHFGICVLANAFAFEVEINSLSKLREEIIAIFGNKTNFFEHRLKLKYEIRQLTSHNATEWVISFQ